MNFVPHFNNDLGEYMHQNTKFTIYQAELGQYWLQPWLKQHKDTYNHTIWLIHENDFVFVHEVQLAARSVPFSWQWRRCYCPSPGVPFDNPL